MNLFATIGKAKLTDVDIQDAAKTIGCSVAAIRAVDEVESGGKGFWDNGTMVILFEPHIFWKQLRKHGIDPEPYAQKYPGLLSPTWNPKLYKGYGTSWEKMAIAKTIHLECALMSASFGRYQVLGENFKMLGFASAREMVNFLDAGEPNHLRVFVRYIKAACLDDELRALDWAGFAAGYNGPMYRKNNYDGKLKFAYLKYNTKVAVKNIVAGIKAA